MIEKEKFETIIKRLISDDEKSGPLTGIHIDKQFLPDEMTDEAVLRNLNAAFLISLCGSLNPNYQKACNFINRMEKNPAYKHLAGFYRQGISGITSEISKRYAKNDKFRENLDTLCDLIKHSKIPSNRIEAVKRVWRVFFPEGVELLDNPRERISELRNRRTVKITHLNKSPIRFPAKEILFTSNVLLTLPPQKCNLNSLDLTEEMKSRLKKTIREPQLYWYDHPIQIGADFKQNEVIYGLKGLDRAIEFEKKNGSVKKGIRLNCVLSVSVTHAGLRNVARAFLKTSLQQAGLLRHINVYAFNENDTKRLVDELLVPAAKHYFGKTEIDALGQLIGVDGEYGKHFSFLKAISALWQVCIDSTVKGSFKIDLDQVFPQHELTNETGLSALEHFKTPLWGAKGVDEDGNRLELGMIAGALVNNQDISQSLFTPDVGFPDLNIKADDWIFYSPLPQAVSTEAEMMLRYNTNSLDGSTRCLQRIHVTGGTCGILVKALRRYRPFTPSFIGRAEDQAYLLSVLSPRLDGSLKYVHKDGLIMRHDKDSFATDAIMQSHIGKIIGDYIRIILFSYYAKSLSIPFMEIKKNMDPFTGCFISPIPLTMAYLRMALKGAYFFECGNTTDGYELLQMGVARISDVLNEYVFAPISLKEKYRKEKREWNVYYDLLDEIEVGLKRGDPVAQRLKEKAIGLIEGCKIAMQ